MGRKRTIDRDTLMDGVESVARREGVSGLSIDALAKEVGMSAADHATISTAHGSLVVIRINGTRPYTLAALGDQQATLAVLLFAARECAARIRDRL
mgnify:CR=1 FL=1